MQFYRSLIHLLHILRGIIGIAILNSAPPLEDLVENSPLDSISKVDLTIEYIKNKGIEYATNNREQFNTYGIITGFCVFLDIVSFLITLFKVIASSNSV